MLIQKNIALIAHDGKKADFLIHSTLMNEQYSHEIENFENTVKVRAQEVTVCERVERIV